MLRWVCTAVIGAVVTGFAFLLVTGQYINEGEVVTSVTTNHGLHLGDVFVILGWAVSLAALLALTNRAGRRAPGRSSEAD